MKTKNIHIFALLCCFAVIGLPVEAQFIKMDDFVNSHYGVLSGQTSDGPSNLLWQSVGTASTIIMTNSSTPGVGLPGSGTPVTTNAAATTSADGAAYIELPVHIPTTSTQATFFMQFDMGPSQTANNINWDWGNATGSDGGGSQNKIELNANVSPTGRYGVTIRNGGAFVELSADGVNEFVPLNSTVYNIWFVVNNSAQNFVIYMQDADPNGTDLPNLTRMQIATTGAQTGPASYTFTTNAIVYRNTTAAALTLFAFGPGGSGNSTQYIYSLYEDPNSLDLTNPVTGAAPVLLSPPVITSEPTSERLYPGSTAVFTVGATGGGLHYQWKTNGVPLADGGNILGSGTSTLVISNVSAPSVLNYSCLITNATTGAYKSTNTATVSLQLVSPNGNFETAVAAAGPAHFYAFDDNGDPSTGTNVAFDFAGGDNGIYGSQTQDGFNSVAGPRPTPDGFPGFSGANSAAQFAAFSEPSHVTVSSPWNLMTNTVTITAWIFPTSPQDNSSGIVFSRGSGTDVEGLNISTSGNSTLGYTWNADAGTTSWDSGLQPPVGQWSFVALVVTPTNATINLMNTNGLISSTHVFNHVPATFGGTTMIGDDSGTTTGARTFIGAIDEVAVFNQALSESTLQSLFTNASGVASYAPTNSVSLVTPSPIYPAESAQFSSISGGSLPLTYTWQLNGVNLTDGANSVGIISGSSTPFLTISNLAVGDAGQSYNLTLVTSNASGVSTSSVPAVLNVTSPSGAQTIFTLGFEVAGTDWNTGTNWSDGNAASLSVFSEPGSVYQIVPGTLERTPASTNASFPGTTLVIEGNGVLLDGGLAAFNTNTTTGELRLKQSGAIAVTNFGTAYSDGGTVFFPDLQLNGGQIDNGTSSKVTLQGELDVLTNSSIYVDSAANGAIRTIEIDSLMTGSGTITYSYLSTATASNDLIITDAGNTFSGQWNIQRGTLLGTAPNCLGTNSITVGPSGALETTYNINNPAGNLILTGQCHLYTSNRFNAVTINGASVAPGTYTFAQLSSAYPSNFPAVWPVQVGASTGTNTGTGSITVLTTLVPQITQQPTPDTLSLYPGQTAQFTVAALNALNYQWWFTNISNIGVQLSDNGSITGSKSNVLTITGVTGGSAGTYSVVIGNAVGSVTTSNATLAILTPGTATLITMSVVETLGQDWDTGTNWSDGNPASLSEFSEPGSVYEVLSGAVLRTPDSAANTAFPGNQLVITNGGVLLLEHSGARSIAFPDLQLNGGSMDNGADGLATLTGQLDIANNVTIYTDANAAPGVVVNFDTPGGVGGTNYQGQGAFPDQAGNTNWNPVSGTSGTTVPPSLTSDGLNSSQITLTENAGSFGVGVNYGSYDNSAGTPGNTPPALEDNYLWVANNFIPNFVQEVITNAINDVPAGTYDLYLYGNNGGNASGFNGTAKQNDWGTTFTVSSDLTPAVTLSTSNSPASYTSNTFIEGVDYVVFTNVMVGGGGTITFTWTANTNISTFAGANAFAAFNGLQLATFVPPASGPRPIKVASLLTGNGTINYSAGDTNFASDLNIACAANTFTGPWNVMQGTLLGSAANSLGTNAITVGAAGALETTYNVNNTAAGLVLNGRMFLHQTDTFQTLSVNGANVSPGAYTFAQLNHSFPQNFPASWPLQAGSTVSTGSGSLTVLSGPAPTAKPAKIVTISLHGNSLTLSGTNGAATGGYHVLTSTNVTLPQAQWTVVTNGSFDGGGNFNITIPYSSGDQQRYYSIESP